MTAVDKYKYYLTKVRGAVPHTWHMRLIEKNIPYTVTSQKGVEYTKYKKVYRKVRDQSDMPIDINQHIFNS